MESYTPQKKTTTSEALDKFEAFKPEIAPYTVVRSDSYAVHGLFFRVKNGRVNY
jgi:hypothetical protein